METIIETNYLKNKYSVYFISFPHEGIKYCGITNNLKARIKSYKLDIRHNKQTKIIQKLKEVGIENCQFISIYKTLTSKYASIIEERYIKLFNLISEGYNTLSKSTFSKDRELDDYKFNKTLFETKINKTNSCWNWIGRIHPNGYGIFNSRHETKAHRVSYLLYNGHISNNLHVLHKCDNPKCVRPDHLFLGTHQDNMTDKCMKNRTSRMLGEIHPQAKITSNIVINIRQEYSMNNISQRDLAKKYGLSQTHVKDIIKKTVWKHI